MPIRPALTRLGAALLAGLVVTSSAGAGPSPRPAPAPARVAPGAITGVITDRKTGEPLAGATLVATAASGETLTDISDEAGHYRLILPPGTYTLTVYYLDLQVERSRLVVTSGKDTMAALALDTSASRGELITIEASPPTIDQGTTRTGVTLTDEYTVNIPTGRTFGAVLGTAAGSQGSGYGVSFSGSTSVQNTYVVGGDEGPQTEAYARLTDSPFLHVGQAPLSTFSIDVDTASYANLRRFVREGTRPPADAIRVEELLNYFRYDDALPTGKQPFAVTAELGPSPWHAGYQVLRIALRSKAIAASAAPPRNLVFLLDVSGSMSDANKLPLLRQAMGLLVNQLRPQDRVSIVVYAGAEGLALPPTRGDDKATILGALAGLEAGGSTNGGAGLALAYAQAEAAFLRGGVNRVILCTDGDFNVGLTSEGELTRLIERERERGVDLTVLGFGMGNLKDSTMEALADKGNGNYAYIDSLAEARKVLVAEAGATLVTVAKDVKLQVELNPAKIAGYRLIGYEDRRLADRDFADDTKDAGELGAGHSVTALYELIPVGQAVPGPAPTKLTYQAPTTTTGSSDLLTINVRYKPPGGSTSTLSSFPVRGAPLALARTSNDFRWSLAIAGFGMLLRESPERGEVTWDQVTALAKGALGADREGYRREALTVIAGARKLTP